MFRFLHRIRLIPAVGLLVARAIPRFPESVDDVYIVADYARHWVATGRLEWTTGERVEGYSSIVSVGLAAMIHAFGPAPELALKGIAAAATLGIGILADSVFPRSWSGTVALFALLLATPTVRWAVDGMDGPLFALSLAAGWLALHDGKARGGLAILAFASLVRPEGVVHVATAAALVVGQAGARRSAHQLLPAGIGLVGYHAIRMSYFGEFVSTPTLLKIVGTSPSIHGFWQAVQDVGPFVGVFCLLGSKTGIRYWVAWVPLLLQMAVEVRAGGDWMLGGRLVMPGAIATAILLANAGRRNGSGLNRRDSPAVRGGSSELVPILRQSLGVIAAILGCLYLPAGWGRVAFDYQKLPGENDLVAGTNRGLVTPLPEDVAWIVEHVPVGGSVLINDVGMVGGIPGVGVLDIRGLVTRASAEADLAGRQPEWFAALLASKARPFAVRVAWWGDGPQDVPEWLGGKYATTSTLRYPGGLVGWFSDSAERLPVEEIEDRWRELSAQHPDHPWIAWRAALAAANAGKMDEAHALARAAVAKWPQLQLVADEPTRWSFASGDVPLEWESGRGFVVDGSGTLVSRPIACRAATLGVEVPPSGSARVALRRTDVLDSQITELPGGASTVEFPSCWPTGRATYELRVAAARPGQRIWVSITGG